MSILLSRIVLDDLQAGFLLSFFEAEVQKIKFVPLKIGVEMTQMNVRMGVLAVLALVVVILIIVAVLHRRKERSREEDANTRGRRQENQGDSSGSGSRWETRAPRLDANRPSNYRVMNGSPVQAPETAQQPQVPVNAFPRHPAQAGNKSADVLAQVREQSQKAQISQSSQPHSHSSHGSHSSDSHSHKESQHSHSHESQPHSHHSNRSHSSDSHSHSSDSKSHSRHESETSMQETVYVESIAELYSPKEDIEAELGVTEEELQKMVQSYKKSHEYRERRVPVSRYFSLGAYNESKAVLRASAVNVGQNHASKRGKITEAVYKKYGKNFTTQRSQPQGDVMSLTSTPELHARQMELEKSRRNPGHLVVRE
jgi:hypothetical protein